MKAYKVEVLVLDFENYGKEQIDIMLGNVPGLMSSVHDIKEADIGDWTDSHPLNNSKTSAAEFRRLFGESGSAAAGQEPLCTKWAVYFKGDSFGGKPGYMESWQLGDDAERALSYYGVTTIEKYEAREVYVYAAPAIAAPTEVERDAKRLDWLGKNSAYVGVNPHSKTCLWTLRNIVEIPGKDFRAAIDAAIATGEKNV